MNKEAGAATILQSAKERLDFLAQVYNRLNQQATQADTKAGVILSFHSVWIISLAPNVGKLFIDFSTATYPQIALWIAAFTFLVLFALSFARSSYNAFLVLLPRVTRQQFFTKGLPSVIFFGGIATLAEGSLDEKAQAYSNVLNQTTDETLAQDYINRICDVSTVVQTKYEHATRSIRWSVATFALWACTLVLLSLLDKMK